MKTVRLHPSCYYHKSMQQKLYSHWKIISIIRKIYFCKLHNLQCYFWLEIPREWKVLFLWSAVRPAPKPWNNAIHNPLQWHLFHIKHQVSLQCSEGKPFVNKQRNSCSDYAINSPNQKVKSYWYHLRTNILFQGALLNSPADYLHHKMWWTN